MFKKISLISFLILSFTLFSQKAHAYVDPATIGYLYQLLFFIFSFVMVALAFLRNHIARAVNAVGRFIKNLFSSNT